jgi:DNA-binding SARP family transcriptional activator
MNLRVAQPLHIHLLGGFHLLSGETPISTLDLPRLQALLAYLVLHQGTPQLRSHLAYLFWPDSTDSQAYTNLRNLIHKLRQLLPDADRFLDIERHTLTWKAGADDVPWTFDVLDFEQALETGRRVKDVLVELQALTRGVKLYRGDLLPSCYDDWILAERDRLRQMFLKALDRLSELQAQQGDYDAAIQSAQRWQHSDPLHEETYRRLMSLHAANGDRAAALCAYHTCANVLERELGIEPGKVTRESYEHLLKSEAISIKQASPAPTLAAAAPLVGRKQEWATLLAAWRNAAKGRSQMFLLTGEAGVGKTRLAEELLIWAERQGSSAAIAHCYASEGSLAYAPLAAWLHSGALRLHLSSLPAIWLTEVARLLPHLLVEQPDLPHPGSLTEGWQRQRFFEALARAVLHKNQPLLLLLDDIQWCDHETLEWLHYVLRFDSKAPLLVLGTVRSEEMADNHVLAVWLSSLRRDGEVTEVTLNPLNAEETAHLAATLAGEELAGSVGAALYRETEGNPLFIVETVRAGSVEKVKTGQLALEDTGGHADGFQHIMLPATVQAVIAARLAQLSSIARKVMGVAAVIGRAFTLEVLKRASKLDEDALVVGLDELWQRRVIREQGSDGYDFSHDKLREQAYTSLSTARRHVLHRSVADALVSLYTADAESLNAASRRIALHYEQAGACEEAIVYYTRAAERALRIYANAEALVICQQALLLLERIPFEASTREWRTGMMVRFNEWRGDILLLTGEIESARVAYERARSYVGEQDRISRAGLHRKIAKTWETQHQYDDALQAYRAAEEALGSELAEDAVKWWQAWIELQDKMLDMYALISRMDLAAELVKKMRPIVRQYGTPMQRAEFFFTSALSASRLRNNLVTAEDLAEGHAGLEAYEVLGDPLKIGWSHLSLAFLHVRQATAEGLAEAEIHVREAISLGERIGDAMLLLRSLSTLVLVCRGRGDVEGAKQALARALPLSIELQQHRTVGQNKANQSWVAWREGKLAEAEQLGWAALVEWQLVKPANYYSQWTALLPLISIALGRGRLLEAVNFARGIFAPEQEALPEKLRGKFEAAFAAWDAGQPEQARAFLQEGITTAREQGWL